MKFYPILSVSDVFGTQNTNLIRLFRSLFAGSDDFVPFALTNDDKKGRYVNDTFDANSMAQTWCYVNDTVNGVGQSIDHWGQYFTGPTYQGQQSVISVSKELGPGPNYEDLFVCQTKDYSSCQNFLFFHQERSSCTSFREIDKCSKFS